MGAPFHYHLLADPSRHAREIDNHWALQTLAQEGDKLRTSLRALHEHQVRTASSHLTVLEQSVGAQRATTAAIEQLGFELAGLEQGLGYIEDRLAEANAIHVAGYNAVVERLESVAELLERNRTLLEHRLGTEIREKVKRAEEAIRTGVLHSGTIRERHFDSAAELLRDALSTPMGRLDHLGWFELGWVRLRQGRLEEADEALDEAVTFAAAEGAEVAQALARRHLAHVRALRGRPAEALALSREAAAVLSVDPELDLDQGRYLALLGQDEAAVAAVRRYLERRPAGVAAVLAEPDLARLDAERVALVDELTEEARRAAAVAWARTVAIDAVAREVAAAIETKVRPSPQAPVVGMMTLERARASRREAEDAGERLRREATAAMADAVAEARELEAIAEERLERAFSRRAAALQAAETRMARSQEEFEGARRQDSRANAWVLLAVVWLVVSAGVAWIIAQEFGRELDDPMQGLVCCGMPVLALAAYLLSAAWPRDVSFDSASPTALARLRDAEADVALSRDASVSRTVAEAEAAHRSAEQRAEQLVAQLAALQARLDEAGR